MSAFDGNGLRDLQICVAGPGAIGLTLAARLSVGGFRVAVIARNESLHAIRESGIRLIDREGDHTFRVDVGSASAFPKQDILFLCPKSQDMPALANAVRSVVGADTIIVPVINGIPWWYFEGEAGAWAGRHVRSVDPDGSLKSIFRSSQIIGTTTVITAERVQPGFAKTFNPLQMTIGEINNEISPRLERLAAVLQMSGIDVQITWRIRDAVWTKVVRNLISNPVSAVTGATLRENFGDGYLAEVSRQMLYEVLPVIAAYGARLETDPNTILAAGRKMGDVKTSMLQDLERGAPLELAAICDAVLELAALHGISMPVTQAITGLARFRSRCNFAMQAAQ